MMSLPDRQDPTRLPPGLALRHRRRAILSLAQDWERSGLPLTVLMGTIGLSPPNDDAPSALSIRRLLRAARATATLGPWWSGGHQRLFALAVVAHRRACAGRRPTGPQPTPSTGPSIAPTQEGPARITDPREALWRQTSRSTPCGEWSPSI